MKFQAVIARSALTLSLALAGCASDGSLALSTGSIDDSSQKQAAAQRIDPACVALMAKIDELRKEGTPERLAKVAEGKTATANVKREALARMTELDAANSEFQVKCSTLAAPAKPEASPAAQSTAETVEKKAAAETEKASAEATKQAAAAVTKKVAAAQ